MPKAIYRTNPTYGIRILEKNPPRICQYSACPKRNSGYEGLKMKACSRCHFVRYCSKQCQKEDWSEHKKGCKQFEPVADYEGWMESYSWIFRWAATEALRVHNTDDILHNAVEITATYADRVPAFLGTVPSSFYIIHARVVPLSGQSTALPLEEFFSDDVEKSKEIRANGGVGRALVLFNFLEDPFNSSQKTTAVFKFYSIDMTDPPIPRSTYSIGWNRFLAGVVNGKISIADLSRSIELQPVSEERHGDDAMNDNLEEVVDGLSNIVV